MSEPSRGPHSHILTNANGRVHELVDDGTDTWTELTSYSYAELGMSGTGPLHLGADALRFWHTDTDNEPTIIYGDRMSVNDPFTTGIERPSV